MKKPNLSAGILMYCRNNGLKVFLVHPGGPFFTKKDNGYWGIPKGLPDEGEELETAARREFEEETGKKAEGHLIPLGSVIQKGGKNVHCFAMETDNDAQFDIVCNNFSLEWPPNSGKIQQFPEVDKGEFFDIETAREKINQAQLKFLDDLQEYLKGKK
jgi:predicted NUDIX family NTP pyrophosphohydrolase